jgi:nitrile hydratase accessory protein
MTTLKDSDPGSATFAEPWQAQAFALAVSLSDQGHFTWKEWTAALADQLRAAEQRGEPDDGSRYYEYWLAALETLVAAKGLANPTSLQARKEAWAAAYRHTPHGQPVELLESQTPDTRWLLLGLVSTLATYWVLQRAAGASIGEAELSALPSGLAASAGLGMMLGMRHALEPDHLAAISTLMTGERSSAKAAWLGMWWGLGHMLTLFAAGALLIVLQTEMPAVVAQTLQFLVVALLIGFGVRAIYQSARRLPEAPTHSHGPPRALSRLRVNRWTLARPFLVGAVHGLAGSGALIAMVATALPSTITQLSYLMLFGVGSTLAMAAMSGLLGWPLARFGANRGFVRIASLAVGAVSVALGLLWGYPFVAE